MNDTQTKKLLIAFTTGALLAGSVILDAGCGLNAQRPNAQNGASRQWGDDKDDQAQVMSSYDQNTNSYNHYYWHGNSWYLFGRGQTPYTTSTGQIPYDKATGTYRSSGPVSIGNQSSTGSGFLSRIVGSIRGGLSSGGGRSGFSASS